MSGTNPKWPDTGVPTKTHETTLEVCIPLSPSLPCSSTGSDGWETNDRVEHPRHTRVACRRQVPKWYDSKMGWLELLKFGTGKLASAWMWRGWHLPWGPAALHCQNKENFWVGGMICQCVVALREQSFKRSQGRFFWVRENHRTWLNPGRCHWQTWDFGSHPGCFFRPTDRCAKSLWAEHPVVMRYWQDRPDIPVNTCPSCPHLWVTWRSWVHMKGRWKHFV